MRTIYVNETIIMMSTEPTTIDRVPSELEWRMIRRELAKVDEYHPERGAEFLPVAPTVYAESFGDRISRYWRNIKLAAKLSPYFVQLIIGSKMKNWKTTLGAIVGGVATVLNVLGIVEIGADIQMALVTIGLFIVGLFAGDAQKDETK